MLSRAPLGEATHWKPVPTAPLHVGCHRYPYRDDLVLVLMREIGDERIALARRLHDARLEANARLATSFARQLNVPLTALAAASASPSDPHEVRRALAELRRVVDGALDFVRVGPPAVWNVNLEETIAHSIQDARAAFPSYSRAIDVELDEDACWGRGNPFAIEKIVTELIANAIQAGPSSEIHIASSRKRGAIDQIEIAVEDEGPGFTAELVARVFDPFFTTRPEGTGVGLTTAREAATDLGGDLRAERGARGARFVLSLVASDCSSARGRAGGR